MKNTKTNVGRFASANLKTVSYKLIAIIALAAIIGFSFTACKNDGPPPPPPVEKQIQITDIPKSVFSGYTKYDDFEEAVSLVPTGTELTDPAVFMSKVVAYGRSWNNEDWGGRKGKTIEDFTTDWIWLYNTNGDRYTGTGTFDVYYAIADAKDIDKLQTGDMGVVEGMYKAESVSVTDANTDGNIEVKWDDTFGKNKIK
jgi:hypothetical protein